MGGGVVLTHDGLEVSHREETFFDGATPLFGEAVIRQRRKIPPHFRDNAVDKELDLGEVGRALGEVGDGILVVGGEAVYLQDHPDGRGGRAVVRIGLAGCIGTGNLLLSGGGDGGGGGRLGGGLGWHGLVGGGGRVIVSLFVVCDGGTGVGLAVFMAVAMMAVATTGSLDTACINNNIIAHLTCWCFGSTPCAAQFSLEVEGTGIILKIAPTIAHCPMRKVSLLDGVDVLVREIFDVNVAVKNQLA